MAQCLVLQQSDKNEVRKAVVKEKNDKLLRRLEKPSSSNSHGRAKTSETDENATSVTVKNLSSIEEVSTKKGVNARQVIKSQSVESDECEKEDNDDDDTKSSNDEEVKVNASSDNVKPNELEVESADTSDTENNTNSAASEKVR
jgi:hypothetical protein